MGSFLLDLLPVKKEDRQQDSKGGGKETMEKWPLLDNCNVKVYLTGLNETTLREVKKELSTFVAGRCLHQIHVSKRSETDEKLSVLDDNSVVICCVHNRGRIIIISDTEPDEAGDIVKKAEEACGKQQEGKNEWPGETAMATDGGMMEQVPAKTTSSKDEGEYIVDNKDMMQF
ncbi:hypothetical protein Bbelb_059610 [Branchiostoma belcheri]|nr:hypothetical protein Bbelb_059610 [Branchiostoma belcheri]